MNCIKETKTVTIEETLFRCECGAVLMNSAHRENGMQILICENNCGAEYLVDPQQLEVKKKVVITSQEVELKHRPLPMDGLKPKIQVEIKWRE